MQEIKKIHLLSLPLIMFVLSGCLIDTTVKTNALEFDETDESNKIEDGPNSFEEDIIYYPRDPLGWQKTLEQSFDVVSTFDELDDYHGTKNAYNALDGDQGWYDGTDVMPTLSETGAPSIWRFYSYGLDSTTDWIQFHGKENVWRGIGKSAIIDYGSGTDGIKRGPTRLSLKIGNSPSDGYDDVHVFHMARWYRSFFQPTLPWFKFLKILELGNGFETVRRWGTPEEHEWVKNLDCSRKEQVLKEYGQNALIFNLTTDQSQIKGKFLGRAANSDCSYGNNDFNGSKYYPNIMPFVEKDEWFGLEIRIKSSKPAGAANGIYEAWVYDGKTGEVADHVLIENTITVGVGYKDFNHKWNKVTFGGNRQAKEGLYCPVGTGDLCVFGPTDFFRFDDVIVHGERIGPKYFEVLKKFDAPK